MNTIKKKIQELSQINLENFNIDVLQVMQSEIKDKQNKLLKEIEQINNSIEGANIYKEYYGETKLLPEKFSAPLRRIISKQREIKDIKKYYSRYEEENFRLEDIIKRKIIDEKQNIKFGIGKFTKIKDKILAILIVVVLGLLFFEIINKDLNQNTLIIFFIIDALCCLVFQVNFFFELYLSPSKKWYLRNHWIDFITSIPIPNYELLRIGRFIRLFRLIRFLRFLRILKIFKLISFLWKGMDTLSEIFDVKLMKRTLVFSVVLLVLGALIINYVEHGNNDGLNGYKNSLWWSFNAIITGGFADIYNPKTSGGMVLTTILVFIGMVLISVFTATLTTLMVGDDSNQSSDNLKLYVENRLNEIDRKLDNITKHNDSIK